MSRTVRCIAVLASVGALACVPASANALTTICKIGSGCIKSAEQCMSTLGNGYVVINDPGDQVTIQDSKGVKHTYECREGNWVLVALAPGESEGIRGAVIGRGVFVQGPPTPPEECKDVLVCP